MHWTATTRDLTAALLDPVRGVIERALASHELALASAEPQPPAGSTLPLPASTAAIATTNLPAAPVHPAPTQSPHSARSPLASAHHEPRPAPSSPPGANPHASDLDASPPPRTTTGHAAPRPVNHEHSASSEIADAHREHTTAPRAGLERIDPSGPDTNDEHSPPPANPAHSAPRVRPAHAAPPPNYEHTSPRANYQHSPAPANHEHSAPRTIHEPPAPGLHPEPAALADRKRSADRPRANDEHSTATATPGVPLHAHPRGPSSPSAAAPAPSPATTAPPLATHDPPAHPIPRELTSPVGVPICPRTPPLLPITPQPDRRNLAAAHHLTGALHPVLTTAAALTTAALAAQDEPRVANHFAVQVQVGAHTSAVDPDALTAALLTLLREAAYRHGLEVE